MAADFTPNQTTICSGESVTFTNTSTTAETYNWNFDQTGLANLTASPANSTAESPTVTFDYTGASTGTFTVELVSTNACGLASTPFTQTINIDPQQSLTSSVTANTNTITDGSNIVICETDNLDFDASGSTNVQDYNWDFGGAAPNSTAATPATLSGLTAGTYTITLTQTTPSPCPETLTETYTLTVNVGGAPDATFTATPIEICAGEDVAFTATSSDNLDYRWDFDPIGVVDQTGANTHNSPRTPTNARYVYRSTSRRLCRCTATETYRHCEPRRRPLPLSTASDTEVCEDN